VIARDGDISFGTGHALAAGPAPRARTRTRVLALPLALAGACNHPTTTVSEPIADAPASSQPYTSRADPALVERITRRFGVACRFRASCGDLVAVDCGARTDGPLYVVRRDTLEVIMDCGGRCMAEPCTECPPAEWTTCRASSPRSSTATSKSSR
jgi:hypothetical protein